MKLPTADNPCYTACDEINEIIKPLREYFGINGFCFNRVYWNGDRMSLSNHLASTHWYFQNEKYLISDGIPDITRTGMYLLSDFDTRNTRFGNELVEEAADLFDLCHGAMFCSSHLGYIDVFTIYVPRNRPEFERQVLHHQDFFYKFIAYFRDKASHLFKQAEEKKFNIPLQHGTLLQSQVDRNNSILQSLVSELVQERFYLEGEYREVYLTKREVECLELIIAGNNYYQVAKLLDISRNTVQFHVNNMLAKLNCSSRAELKTLVAKRSLLDVINANHQGIQDEYEYQQICDEFIATIEPSLSRQPKTYKELMLEQV